MVPVSVAAIVNYFEKHALCSCSLSLSLLPLCFFILLLVTSLALEPPISCLASPRLASPCLASPRLASPRHAAVSSFSANWYYGSALSSETEMQVRFTRVFTRDAHLHSRCSRSPVSATRVICAAMHVHGHRYRCGNASRRRREEAANFD